MGKEESIHFRISKETKEKAKEVAKRENRTRNNWYEKQVDEAYKKMK